MFKRKPSQKEIDDLANIMKILGEIYSNKSSDEFKCKGDIRKVRMYKEIEKQIANLSTLKKFPKTDAQDIKTMFLTLHRPIFPQGLIYPYAARNFWHFVMLEGIGIKISTFILQGVVMNKPFKVGRTTSLKNLAFFAAPGT